MTRVDFDLATERAPVPVEIYDEDLVLVERQMSNESARLKPGAYFAVRRTPAGREVQAKFQVGTDPSATVSLGVISEAGDSYIEFRAPRKIALTLARLVRDFREPRLRMYPRLTSGEWRRGPKLKPGEDASAAKWPIGIAEGAVALEQREAPGLFVRVPEPALPYLTFDVRRENKEPADLFAGLRHPEASALLAYLDVGQIGLASVLATSPGMSAEELLGSKVADPLAAAASAYVLLQLGEIERLHDWSANLRDWFDWLPDGLVVSAEHLARVGRHDEALAELRTLTERGIPCLSVGLGMATDRLRSYARLRPEDEHLRRALEELTRYALATDFSKPVTTFTGRAPDRPGLPPPTRPNRAARVLSRMLPDVMERPDGSPVFRFRLPKALRRDGGATTLTQRSNAMAEPPVDTPTANRSRAEGDTENNDGSLTVVRVSFAVVLTVVFLVAAYLLYQASDTKDSLEWERLVFIFGAIEAVTFTAIGWVFGREINRQRADAAEQRADNAETEKDVEKSTGAKLAGLVVGERASGGGGGTGSLQPHGAEEAGRSSSVAAEFAKEHYGV